MDTKQLSDKLLTKLRELSEKPGGWGDIRMIEPADARSILAALAPSDAAGAPHPIAWFIPDDNGEVYRATGYEHERDAWRGVGHDVQPLYAAPVAPAAPEGWKLVPTFEGKLVTKAMDDAAEKACAKQTWTYTELFRAMIEVAPTTVAPAAVAPITREASGE